MELGTGTQEPGTSMESTVTEYLGSRSVGDFWVVLIENKLEILSHTDLSISRRAYAIHGR